MTIAERLGRGKKERTQAVKGDEEYGEAYIEGEELVHGDVGGKRGGRLSLPQGVLTVLMLFLASASSFGLGMLAEREGRRPLGAEDGFWIEKLAAADPGLVASSTSPSFQASSSAEPSPGRGAEREPSATAPATGSYLASRSGTTYYLPWCGAAKRIKEENKVWFASRAEAEAKGYKPAKNCKGL